MSAVCLSPVSILRCIDLSLLDTKLLLIPPALELVFAAGLMFAGRGQGRQVLHLFGLLCVWEMGRTLGGRRKEGVMIHALTYVKASLPWPGR